MAEVKSTELLKLEGQRTELLGGDTPSFIGNDTELAYAAEFLAKVRAFLKNATSVRVLLVKPLNDHVRNINADFTELLTPINEAERTVTLAMQKYRQVQLDKQQADQVLLQQQAEEELAKGGSLIPEAVATVADAPEKKIETSVGNVNFVKNWTYRITDEDKIPRKFLVLDRGKILAVVKAMKADADIPGIEVYCEEIPASRGR